MVEEKNTQLNGSQNNEIKNAENDVKKDINQVMSEAQTVASDLNTAVTTATTLSSLLEDFKKDESLFVSFLKKHSIWFIASIILLTSTVLLSIDPILTISDILYRTGMSLFIVSLAYAVRRKTVGHIKWVHPYDKIYALVILVVIALVFTFVKVPQINFVVNRGM